MICIAGIGRAYMVYASQYKFEQKARKVWKRFMYCCFKCTTLSYSLNSAVSFDYSVTHLGRERFHGEINREMGLIYQKKCGSKVKWRISHGTVISRLHVCEDNECMIWRLVNYDQCTWSVSHVRAIILLINIYYY